MSANRNNPKRNFASILGNLKTTTQLLGLAILIAEATLIYVATILEGKARVLIITAILVILALTIVGAIFLESLRIRKSTSPNSLSNRQELPSKYDVFISAPMDAYQTNQGEQQKHRNNIMEMKKALRVECNLDNAFYAGTDIVDRQGFQQPSVAVRENYQNLQASQKFILIYPEKLASSVLVEVGMALAFRKNSVWFVRDGVQLPYLMRDASNASNQDGLPKISIYRYKRFDDILRSIHRDRDNLFS